MILKDPLQILELEQGSDEWLRVRNVVHPFTASRSPEACGVGFSGKQGPNKMYQILVTGTEPEITFRAPLDYGNATETEAKMHLDLTHGIGGDSPVGARGKYLASLDVRNRSDGLIVDCKCPYTLEESKTWKSALEGKIEEKYEIQLQHQMEVFDHNEAALWVYIPGKEGILVRTKRDPTIFERIQDAWEAILKRIENDGVQGTPEFVQAAVKYVELLPKFKEMEEQIKFYKSQMEAAGGGQTDFISVTSHTRKGAVSWQKAFAELGPKDADLSKFKGKDTEYFKITVKDA